MIKIQEDIVWYSPTDCLPRPFELCLAKNYDAFPVAAYCKRYTNGTVKWFTVADVEIETPNWWASMPFGPNLK